MIENENCKLNWDFKYQMCKTTTARRLDVTIEIKKDKKIYLIDMEWKKQRNRYEK